VPPLPSGGGTVPGLPGGGTGGGSDPTRVVPPLPTTVVPAPSLPSASLSVPRLPGARLPGDPVPVPAPTATVDGAPQPPLDVCLGPITIGDC
jgi:hypothetical protein